MIDLAAFSGLDRAQELDATRGETGYLITGPSGSPIRLSASVYHLLRAARSGVGWEVIAERLSRQRGQTVSAGDLEASYRRAVERIATLEARGKEEILPPGFWLRLPLLSRTAVSRAAGRLAFLFAPRTAVAVIAVIVLAAVHALSGDPRTIFESAVFWPAYALFAASLIAHELGHAAACRRYGAQPADIGFTVYWVFPAFYSDVTAAWQLTRRQRVVVDLGGAFFQLAAGAGYWLLFLATGWRAFEAACFMILCGCLFSLNPIFKLDGYWVLADALGVPNLSRQGTRLWHRLADRLRGRAGAALPWPRWVSLVIGVYAPLAVAFWIYFVCRLAPVVWERVVAYPPLLWQIGERLVAAGTLDPGDLRHLLVSTFLLFASGLMIRQLGARLKAGLGQLARPRIQ